MEDIIDKDQVACSPCRDLASDFEIESIKPGIGEVGFAQFQVIAPVPDLIEEIVDAGEVFTRVPLIVDPQLKTGFAGGVAALLETASFRGADTVEAFDKSVDLLTLTR